MDAQPLPSEPHLDNGLQTDLATRDLDDDQLSELLEAIQLETARKEGPHPHTVYPGGPRSVGSWCGMTQSPIA